MLIVALVVASGLVGGIVATWAPQGVHALAKGEAAKVTAIVALAMASGLGMVAIWGSRDRPADGGTGGKVLTAEEFRVVDGGGKVRASLGVSPDGSLGLRLADGEGKIRGMLYIGADGESALNFYNQGGNARAQLALSRDGLPGLVFSDEDGMS